MDEGESWERAGSCWSALICEESSTWLIRVNTNVVFDLKFKS